MAEILGYKIYKTPLQVQLFTTRKCNRECSWCIEKDNMHRKHKENDSRYIANLRVLLSELNNKKIPYNIVITGGEPTLNEGLVLKILDTCKDLMPSIAECYSSDDNRKTRAYKIGINTNGDKDSIVYKHNRLNYIDVSFIDKIRDAKTYNKRIPIRLQTVYRKSVFGTGVKSIIQFIEKAIKYGYDSILFRQLVGEHPDKMDILKLEMTVAKDKRFAYQDYQINVYDLWVRYRYKDHDVYFKRQDFKAQQLFERLNYQNISSVVIWPDGKITKSWDYNNNLNSKKLK